MGETRHDGLAIPGRVVLAHEPTFTLGALRVDPANRQVERGGLRETLEPRVMQVLVALARGGGVIITRDELVDRCWDGRIITDDAINRVLSRIRQLAHGIAGGSFKLETITKVGYRLVERDLRGLAGPLPETAADAPVAFRRRTVLAGAAAAATAATAGAVLWNAPWRHRPPPEAMELFRRGEVAQQAGTPEQGRQAASFFEQAVRVDPLYGEAWGALALAYTHGLDGVTEAEVASLPGRIRSAAKRALELEAGNPDALLALICIKPAFRNWSSMERDLRPLCDRFPRHWLAHGRLAGVLYQVGRLDDGIELHKRVIAMYPMLPGPYSRAAPALSSAGRVQEADRVLRQAYDRWPANPMLWPARYDHLLFSGRPQSAAAFLMDPEALPSGFGPMQVEPRLRLARAVEKGQRADIESSIEHYMRLAVADVRNIRIAAPVFALLGRLDLTFASLDRYYFNRGSFGIPGPIGPLAHRYTDMLFKLPMAAARADPRFTRLAPEVGLEDYWRKTRTVPDYRQPI